MDRLEAAILVAAADTGILSGASRESPHPSREGPNHGKLRDMDGGRYTRMRQRLIGGTDRRERLGLAREDALAARCFGSQIASSVAGLQNQGRRAASAAPGAARDR
jgi:hypothetical protein